MTTTPTSSKQLDPAISMQLLSALKRKAHIENIKTKFRQQSIGCKSSSFDNKSLESPSIVHFAKNRIAGSSSNLIKDLNSGAIKLDFKLPNLKGQSKLQNIIDKNQDFLTPSNRKLMDNLKPRK